jgi:glycosyltransferase involved in cell wall biosynthesis
VTQDHPTVSIVLPYYNRVGLVEETVGRVRAQSFSDYELVCVDDGSSDTSRDVVREVSNGLRTQHLSMPVNCGPGAARAAGLKASLGKYVLYLDSDDLLEPEALQEHVRVLDAGGADVSYADALYFRGELEERNTRAFPPHAEALIPLLNSTNGGWWRPTGGLMICREFAERAEWRNDRLEEVHYYCCLWALGARFQPTNTLGIRYRYWIGSTSTSESRVSNLASQVRLSRLWAERTDATQEMREHRRVLLQRMKSTCDLEHKLNEHGVSLS